MEKDPLNQPIFTAADLLAYRRAKGLISRVPPPEAVVFCLHGGALKRVIRKRRVQKISGFFGDVYLLLDTAGKIAIAGNFGIGAPGAVVLLEDLAAFGVKRFAAVGVAGGLQSGLHTGDLVICAGAIRDEGTSFHYLEPSKTVEATLDLPKLLLKALVAKGFSPRIGISWTVDAPDRELCREVLRYQQEGVLTVEMEAAALFAAGRALEKPIGAAFVIGDTLSGLNWQMAVNDQKMQQGLDALIEAILFALLHKNAYAQGY
jgi:uridine phosphorylase